MALSNTTRNLFKDLYIFCTELYGQILVHSTNDYLKQS